MPTCLLLKAVLAISIIPAGYNCATSNKGMAIIDTAITNVLDSNSCAKQLQFGRCKNGANCKQVTCSANLTSESVTVTTTIQRCSDPVTTETHIKSSDSKLDWTHTFTSSDKIPIPGFYYQHVSVVYGAFLETKLKLNGTEFSVKISFMYGSNQTTVASNQILGHVFLLSRKGCWFLSWWGRKTNTEKIAILVAMVIFVKFILFICCCFLFNSCKRNKNRRDAFDHMQSMKMRARYIHLNRNRASQDPAGQ